MLNDGMADYAQKEKFTKNRIAKEPKDDETMQGVSRFRSALSQVLASTAKNLILMDVGMTIAFPTIVIPALINNNTGHGMSFSTSDASWFGSLVFICQPLGSILSGIFLEPLGRKISLMIVNLPHLFSWVLFYYASSVRTIFIANIIMGLVMSINSFVATVLCMVFVRTMGKRPLSLISLFCNTVAIYSLSLYAKLNQSGELDESAEPSWVPFIIFFILQFIFSFGVAPVPWILVSEVFPFRGRSQATGFAAACSHIIAFASTKSFLGLESSISLSGVTFMYGTCSLIGFFVMYKYLPETEGRTLEEIEYSFRSEIKQKQIKSIT